MCVGCVSVVCVCICMNVLVGDVVGDYGVYVVVCGV